MSESLYTRDILRLATNIPHRDRLSKPDAVLNGARQFVVAGLLWMSFLVPMAELLNLASM